MHRFVGFVLLAVVAAAPGGAARAAVTHDSSAQPVPPPPRPPARKPTPVVKPHGPARPHKPVPPPVDPAVSAPAAVAPPAAEKLPDPEAPEGGKPKLPRFASLRADDVNMRAGPGAKYPIEWVYKRRDLPVEIEREFDVWRYVRDADGIRGWMQQATLTGRRNFIVRPADATLREDPNDDAPPVAILKAGVIGRIRSCEAASDWCNVQTGSYRGHLRRNQFWGTLPNEAIPP